jgi:hypothetical protein
VPRSTARVAATTGRRAHRAIVVSDRDRVGGVLSSALVRAVVVSRRSME